MSNYECPDCGDDLEWQQATDEDGQILHLWQCLSCGSRLLVEGEDSPDDEPYCPECASGEALEDEGIATDLSERWYCSECQYHFSFPIRYSVVN